MKLKLFVALIVLGVSVFFGVVIVSNGILAGKYETLFPYVEKDVCAAGETLALEQDLNTTGGTVTIDGNIYSDAGYNANTLYCVDAASGTKRDVTDSTYTAVGTLQARLGWASALGFFVLVMIPILIFWNPLLERFDRVIGYQPSGK